MRSVHLKKDRCLAALGDHVQPEVDARDGGSVFELQLPEAFRPMHLHGNAGIVRHVVGSEILLH